MSTQYVHVTIFINSDWFQILELHALTPAAYTTLGLSKEGQSHSSNLLGKFCDSYKNLSSDIE